MNTNKIEQTKVPFEMRTLKPKETWFDPIGIRLFTNATKRPLTLGFGHNVRTVETIIIIEPENSKEPRNETLPIQDGEIIEEDV